MSEKTYDAIVLGAGPAGEVVAGRLAEAGWKVAIVEKDLIGGATVWVLPSTSGAARGFWDVEPWRELARAALSTSGPL